MKVVEKIKNDIQEISEPFEMAGYLDMIKMSAALYCKQNCPDEVIFENGLLKDITISGIVDFLNSEVE